MRPLALAPTIAAAFIDKKSRKRVLFYIVGGGIAFVALLWLLLGRKI